MPLPRPHMHLYTLSELGVLWLLGFPFLFPDELLWHAHHLWKVVLEFKWGSRSCWECFWGICFFSFMTVHDRPTRKVSPKLRVPAPRGTHRVLMPARSWAWPRAAAVGTAWRPAWRLLEHPGSCKAVAWGTCPGPPWATSLERTHSCPASICHYSPQFSPWSPLHAEKPRACGAGDGLWWMAHRSQSTIYVCTLSKVELRFIFAMCGEIFQGRVKWFSYSGSMLPQAQCSLDSPPGFLPTWFSAALLAKIHVISFFLETYQCD